MLKSLFGGFSRRDLFRGGGWLTATSLFGGASRSVAAATANIYQSIGIRPLVNCKGTFTIISGSQTLPEVKRAMDEASRHYVHLDELMDAVGKRLAELTGAEYGIVTAGCAAALTHATAACIAGADPEKMQRLPYLTGLKSEVIMPRYSRNVYDHAVRMLGVRVVEVNTPEELAAAFNARTAMVMILAGGGDTGPLGTEPVSRMAKQKGVPVIVDAAAEHLTIPNVHLQRGADMVAYSGGKCIRGPQCAGLLLGPRNLLQAAWLNSAPHHAFGRSLKVGKEEIMGMLAAVEMWVKRDHEAEWKQWESWLNNISRSVTKVEGVTTEVLQPRGLSNRSPQLRIQWKAEKLGITGQEVFDVLYEGNPRIILAGSSGDRLSDRPSSVTIMPYMMMPGDDKIAAEKLYAVLAKPPRIQPPERTSGTPANVAGQWQFHLEFVRGEADHVVVFEQKDNQLVGTHSGDILSGDLRGVVEGNQVRFRSSHRFEGTRLGYDFTGTVEGETMRGTVGLQEYGQANWTAQRHRYGQPGGVVRPVKNV
jgi:L-seryl-tRNA(Ser) seleniumtransferase